MKDLDETAEAAVLDAVTHIENEGKVANSKTVPKVAKNILARSGEPTMIGVPMALRIRRAIVSLITQGLLEASDDSRISWKATRMKVLRSKLKPKVFIVHGRDEPAKTAVARFLERLGLDAVILHERAGRGRPMIDKFRTEASNADFVVVLRTPDDKGGLKSAKKLRPRARQNVVFEFGFFIGASGPDRVCALLCDGVEKPSDVEGIAYIRFEKGSEWKHQLVKELQAAEIEVDPGRLIPALQ